MSYPYKEAELIAELRTSNAALKAENEAAVKNMAALQSELAAFKNWQPSDPGTKEAMEKITARHAESQAFIDARNKTAPQCHDDRAYLVAALTASMVRLEEAEKRDEFHVSQCAALTASLAELRKRMGEAREAVVGAAEAMDDGLEQSHDAFLNRALHLLASPPSPAPAGGYAAPLPTDGKEKAK
jgi:chromosome segregation ATPase